MVVQLLHSEAFILFAVCIKNMICGQRCRTYASFIYVESNERVVRDIILVEQPQSFERLLLLLYPVLLLLLCRDDPTTKYSAMI